ITNSTISFIQAQLGVDPSSIGYRMGFSWNSWNYAYTRQHHLDIPIANAVANLAWFDGKIIAFGSSFINESTVIFADTTPKVTFDSIVPTLEDSLQGKLYDVPPSLKFLICPDNSIVLTHVAQFQNLETGAWVKAFACAHSGNLLSNMDFVAHVAYNVVLITKQGLPDGLEMISDPADPRSSPLGWHDDGQNKMTVTA
ncbi:hypothetical protein L208DRAFT_1152967, partial [Tricholoma matsutake]